MAFFKKRDKRIPEHKPDLAVYEDLAILTCLVPTAFQDAEPQSYLCNTSIACCDTVIFSSFILRTFCVQCTSDGEIARKFSERFFFTILTVMKHLYPEHSSIFEEMLDNRLALYDSVFCKYSDWNERMDGVVFEFENVIKSDAIEKKYTPLNEASPLALNGIFDDLDCQISVKALLRVLPKLVSPFLEQTQDGLKKGRFKFDKPIDKAIETWR